MTTFFQTETKEEKAAGQFFDPAEWIIFIVLIAAGLLLRWLFLDARAVHHDESLHMMYGRYFYDFPDIQYYKYDPMLHGPFLYNALRLVYSTFGSSTAAARAFPALLGSFFIFLPFLFRRYFSKHTVLFLTAAIALSPTLVYWSRFIREDVPVLTALAILLYGCTIAKPQYRWALGFLSFGIQICIKENVFVTAALLVGYLLYEMAVYLVVHRDTDTLFARMMKNLFAYPWHALLGFLAAAFIFCYFYSAGFRWWDGVYGAKTNYFTASLTYWINQHNIERIKGPFNFHLYVLGWYELPFVIVTILALARFYWRGLLVTRMLGAISLIAACLAALNIWNQPIEDVWPWSFFKLKDHFDVIGLLLLVPHAVLIPTDHLLRKERALGFWSYFFGASAFAYSFLGEKVPWLSLYPFVPGLIYLALLCDAHYRLRPVADWKTFPLARIFSWGGMAAGALTTLFLLTDAVVPENRSYFGIASDNLLFYGFAVALFALSYADDILAAMRSSARIVGAVNLRNFFLALLCAYSLRAAILTNFVYAGAAREYISQVHTTPEFNSLILAIRKEAVNGIRGYKPLIYATGEAVWPITWYLIDIPEYKFIATPEERKNFTYQFIDTDAKPSEITPGFRSITIPLRGWWVPDFSKMTLKNFLDYSLNHTPWGDTGFTYTKLLVKNSKPEPQPEQ